MALRYTTVKEFWDFMGFNESILDFEPGENPQREEVAQAPVSAGTYRLNQQGVNSDTLALFGTDGTQLTLTTDYTFDSDTSVVTITSAGATSLGSSNNLLAEYEFCSEGKTLNFNKTTALLERMENRLNKDINNVFADQSATNPGYLKIISEPHKGGGSRYVHYTTDYYPLIKLQTTTDGDYTTGGTTLSLTDASGFPNQGTIYIGGNKVTYSAKSSNDLTVPSDTPSISSGAVVRGEVIEISTAASGSTPSFVVLIPDTHYAIDYDTGEIQLQDDYYTFFPDGSISTDSLYYPQFGTEDRLRATYFTAWREPGQDAVIPEEIKELVYMMAGKQVVQRSIFKSNAGQRDNFSAQVMELAKNDIKDILHKYTMFKSKNV